MMHEVIDTKRGRPAGKLTIRKRQVMEFVTRRTEQGRAPTLGEVTRCCGFADRSDARRMLKGLVEMGLLPTDALTKGKAGRKPRGDFLPTFSAG